MSPFRVGLARPATLVLAATTAVVCAVAVTGSAVGSAHAGSAPPTSLYLVQVAGAPVATYTGGVPGINATKPAAGRKIDHRSPDVRAYRGHLAARRADVLKRANIAGTARVYDYSTVFNGFAARLTAVEADKLRHTAGVAAVWKNRTHTGTTFTTPGFVGLDGASGAWRQRFGDPKRAGEGVIIGVLDSGFWPENPSFGPLPVPRPDQAVIDAKWHGSCDPGPESPVACNNKVLGARFFNAGGLSTRNPGEFDSPRDFNGHGSHTASTAGGNHGIAASVNGNAVGLISGMAPAARLAVYKVLYASPDGTQTNGTTADIVAAINQAVDDGVDVINYSIGDDVDSFQAEDVAFLNAAISGVFIAVAAGNAGPGPSTVDNAMPWQTTTAAGTHDRGFTKSVTLGDGRRFEGVGTGPALPSAPLVDAAGAGLPGANPTQVAQCFSTGVLDPAKIAGKVVLCARGGNNRVQKSLAVQQAGGAGMVLFNPTPNTLNADFHFVPSIHVDGTVGGAVKVYAATAGPTAALSAGTQVRLAAPKVTAFSSRGPSVSSGGDLLKPDITAPGADVIAAVAPPNHNGNRWDSDSGTSMASPHIAGIGALLISKNPTWSPMAVRSALMTTASPLDNAGRPIADEATGAAASPLDTGSGQVAADRAFDPGLVYDSGPVDWLRYTCGIGIHLTLDGGIDVCDVVGTGDPSDFNNPSIAIGDLAGQQRVTRMVTNVTGRAGVYEARVQAPPGTSVTVSPSRLVIPPHRSATFTVTVTRTTAAFGEYTTGSLTWRDGRGHSVRSPIAIRPVPLAAPAEIAGTGPSGSATLSLKTGFGGTLTARGFGLAASTVSALALTLDRTVEFDPDNPAASVRTGRVDVTVPAGTPLARVATFDADHPAGTDLDVYVYAKESDGSLTPVATSVGATAQESVTLPGPGEYAVFVDLFAGAATVAARHHRWVVGPASVGNLTVTPATQAATVGAAATVTVAWTDLTAGQRYLGLVEFGNGTAAIGRTVVAVS